MMLFGPLVFSYDEYGYDDLDIDYVDASPPDSELVSLEEIEALKDNPTPSSDFVTKSPSTPSPDSFLDDDSLYGEDIDYVDASPPDSELVSLEVVKDFEDGEIDTDILPKQSSDDDSLYSEDIDYVDASPPDSELVSLEVVKDFDGEIDTDILLTIKDDILREKFLKTFSLYVGKRKVVQSTSILNNLFEMYEHFFCDSEPDSGDFTMDVVEDIFDNPTREPGVHVPSVLPTHPTLHLDSDFTLSNDSLESDLVVSFPFGTRNKIFNPGIFIEV
ncbi:hypothetical protein Tco_0180263 [Tanacetum coccineum]